MREKVLAPLWLVLVVVAVADLVLAWTVNKLIGQRPAFWSTGVIIVLVQMLAEAAIANKCDPIDPDIEQQIDNRLTGLGWLTTIIVLCSIYMYYFCYLSFSHVLINIIGIGINLLIAIFVYNEVVSDIKKQHYTWQSKVTIYGETGRAKVIQIK